MVRKNLSKIMKECMVDPALHLNDVIPILSGVLF